jgi:digeranylgeranylglycerophospholipid reductase
MKYDLIVVGGGPGGLMAARTAAEDGLKVLLIEKKKKITEIRRACLQLWYLKWVCPDGYLEPVSVEKMPDKTRFHLQQLGVSVDYTGPLVPYSNAVWISPAGVQVAPFKNELFAYYFDKEILTADLLAQAIQAGAKVRAGVAGISAENTAKGVKVYARGPNGDEVFEGRKAIAADGVNSAIAASLNMNEKRAVFMERVSGSPRILTGVECPINECVNSHLSWTAPEMPGGNFMLDPRDGEKWQFGGDLEAVKQHPVYADWFKNAKLLYRTAFSATVRTANLNPVAGNVIAIGDAASPIETWVQGSMACGYQAVKALTKEMNGQRGYEEYVTWWRQAFYFCDPGYFKRIVSHHTLTWDKMCTNLEVDYIYDIFKDQRVVPTLELARNPEIIKADRPELYKRVKQGLTLLLKQVAPTLAAYPPEAVIYQDPKAYLKPWPTYHGASGF